MILRFRAAALLASTLGFCLALTLWVLSYADPRGIDGYHVVIDYGWYNGAVAVNIPYDRWVAHQSEVDHVIAQWKWAGCAYYHGSPPHGVMGPFRPFRWHNLRVITIPLWIPAILFSFYPSLALADLMGKRLLMRDRTGLCRHCGYDLRATPHRCPECGAENPSM